MKNTKLVRLVESFLVLPILTISGAPVGPISQVALNVVSTPSSVYREKFNIEVEGIKGLLALNQAVDPVDLEAENLKEEQAKADAIDTYFKARGMPLAGTGKKMVEEAKKNNIDWRLLPAIAVRESTGGKQACKGVTWSAFGWGSCKINFKSHEHAIEIVAKNLGGNNQNTKRHYENKTTIQILRAYNPPSIVPKYAEQVISIMDSIGEKDKAPTSVAVI